MLATNARLPSCVPLIPVLILPALRVLSRELTVLRVSILAIYILRIPSSAYPSSALCRQPEMPSQRMCPSPIRS